MRMALLPSSYGQDGQRRSSYPTLCCYLPLHQPSVVLWDHQLPCSLCWRFICTSCVLHQPSAGSCALSSSTGKRWSNASNRASKRCSSLSRNVTCTVRPASMTWALALAGASGSGGVDVAGEASGSAGWLDGAVWPLVAASHCARTCAAARLAMLAAILCLHQLLGALAKSGQLHSPLTTKYFMVPLDWLATLALPSANSSTSPARTILTAASTRPLHSGNVALALAAISLTASRQAVRAGLLPLCWTQESLSQS